MRNTYIYLPWALQCSQAIIRVTVSSYYVSYYVTTIVSPFHRGLLVPWRLGLSPALFSDVCRISHSHPFSFLFFSHKLSVFQAATLQAGWTLSILSYCGHAWVQCMLRTVRYSPGTCCGAANNLSVNSRVSLTDWSRNILLQPANEHRAAVILLMYRRDGRSSGRINCQPGHGLSLSLL